MSTEKGIQRRKENRAKNQVRKGRTPKQQIKIYAKASEKKDLPKGEGPKRV
jgi:hypothetical protein